MRFDGWEISAVMESPDSEGGTVCEPIEMQEMHDDAMEGGFRVFWTLYGHLPGEGVRAVHDCESLADALEMLGWITGTHNTVAEIAPEDPSPAWGRFYFDREGRP